METGEEINLLEILLPLAGIVFIIVAGVLFLNQQFQKNLISQKLEQEELKVIHRQQLLLSSLTAQEQERKRIAQDMHDELGAVLSIARMHLVQLQQSAGQLSDDNGRKFDNIKEYLDNALVNMRRICHLLMPPQLEQFGLMEAVEATARQVNQAGAISVSIDANHELREMDWLTKVTMYRICLELINNTIKHSGADMVSIRLYSDERDLHCSYRDNGKGVDTEKRSTGIGIQGMVGRATSLGGTFESGNGEDGGYRADICIPLSPHPMINDITKQQNGQN